MPILSGGPLYRDKTKPIEDYTASTGEVFGAAAARAFDTGLSDLAVGAAQLVTLDVSGGLQNIGRVFGVDAAAEFNPSNRVNAADARKAAEKRGVKLDIADDAYFSPGELDTVLRLKERERKQQAVLARRPKTWGGFATEMAGGLAGSLADPVQVAASFIPVVPAARYAMWLERAGSAGGRAAIRAGVGAAEGLVGSAVIEPFAYTRAQKIGLDYTAQDSFLNLAFGTVLGGGFHVAGGALGDVLSPARRAASVAPEMQSRAALHEAVTALDAGRPLDIQPVFENKSGVRPEGGTPASRANPDEPAPFSGERGQNAPSAPKVNAGDTASVVEATLRDLGIPYQVERSQFQSDKFGPSLSTYFRTDKGTFRLSDHLDVTGRDTFLIGDDPAKIRVEMFKAAGVEPTRYDTERLAALREIEAKQREWLRNEPSRKTAALSEWDVAALKDAGLSDLKGPEKTKALKKLRDAARASGEYPPKLPQMPDFGSLPPYRYPDPSAGVREPSIAPEAYDPVTGYEPPEMERVRMEADAAVTRADDDIDGEIEALNEMIDAGRSRGTLDAADEADIQRAAQYTAGNLAAYGDRIFYRGVKADRPDVISVSDRGPLGAGVYLSMQEGVARMYGEKITPARVKGEVFNGLARYGEGATLVEDLRRRIAPFLTEKETARFADMSKGVTEPGDIIDRLARTAEPERMREIMQKAGYSGIESNVDGHEIVVFEPANIIKEDDYQKAARAAEKRDPLNEFDRAALELADAFETKSRISADSYRAAASCLSGLA